MILVVQINPFAYSQKILLSSGESIMCTLDNLSSTIKELMQKGNISHVQLAGPEDYTAKIAQQLRTETGLTTKFSHIEILYQKRGNKWESI